MKLLFNDLIFTAFDIDNISEIKIWSLIIGKRQVKSTWVQSDRVINNGANIKSSAQVNKLLPIHQNPGTIARMRVRNPITDHHGFGRTLMSKNRRPIR